MSDTDNSTMTSPTLALPAVQNDGSVFSLLSLSIAAANAAPIPVIDPTALSGTACVNGVLGLNASQAGSSGPLLSTSVGSGVKQHRRLASTGKARRRLSDARDAATRPSPAALQTTAAALSLASLSLSSPQTPLGQGTPASIPFTATASNSLALPIAIPVPVVHPISGNGTSSSAPPDDGSSIPVPPLMNGSNAANPIAISAAKNGKKRGTDHKCESCSKIYRHPSCLIKHRWEHTPHWREASKFVLSKHQQVQLLEAAAILSHLSPSSSTGTSLPEDRSLWPSFLSGGSLPPPSTADGIAITNGTDTGSAISVSSSPYAVHPTSSSVPASAILGGSNRATSAGPRLHDYSIPASAGGAAGVTQLRPGLLGVPTGPGIVGSASISVSPTLPVPVPNANSNGAFGYHTKISHSWGSPHANGNGHVSSYNSNSAAISSSLSQSYTHSDQRSTGEGGWSLPRSSVRSVSVSSQSRSRSGSASGSRSDDESVDVDVEVEVDLDEYRHGGRYGFSSRGRTWKKEEDQLSFGFSVREEDEHEDGEVGIGAKGKESDWDGMEMEMEMDMD